MQMSDREFDWIFIGLLPPIGALISCALNYSLMRAVMGGRPLTPLQKSINLYLFFRNLGHRLCDGLHKTARPFSPRRYG